MNKISNNNNNINSVNNILPDLLQDIQHVYEQI